MTFEELPDAETVAREAARRVASALAAGARTLVLVGGTTPRRCYQILAGLEVEWGRVTVLFGDERCVGPADPESNFRMARETLLERACPASVHRIPAELGPDAGAAAYEPVVAALQPLDVVLLGVGEDGHTCSLFPGHPAVQQGGWAIGVRGAPKPPPDRVTLSLGALRTGRTVLMLATGAEKAEAVARARDGGVPAGMIEQATWLLDPAAGSAL